MSRWSGLVIGVALVVATLAAYGSVLQNGFVDLDDRDYVLANPYVRQGLSWQTIVWSFTSFNMSNWHPLTWLSWALDARLYGLSPAGFHATNLFWHIISVLLLFRLLREATGCAARSAVVAALFALHPLHVESVAWISERKDVLSTAFGFLALWAHTRYAARPSLGRGLSVAGCLAISLLAKPMFVTFPLVALLWDVWPLRRTEAGSLSISSIGRLVVEKIPLFVLCAAAAAVALAAQRAGGTTASLAELPVGQRLANAAIGYWAYLGKAVWPARLSAFYPLPESAPPLGQTAAATALLAVVSFLVIALRRRAPYLLTGWLWYLVTLLPVIGIVQIGTQRMADRYTYVPLVGIFLLTTWGLGDLVRSWSTATKAALTALTLTLLLACGIATFRQVRHWHDATSLWQRALDVDPENYRAKAHLAQHALQRAQIADSRRLAESSLSDRQNGYAHLVLAAIDFQQRNLDQAASHFQQALQLESSCWCEAENGLGAVLAARGDFADAEPYFRRALALEPYSATAHANLGLTLLNQNRFDEAAPWLRGAVRLDPAYAAAHENLALLSAIEDQWTDALAPCAALVDRDPNEPRYRQLLACVLWETGDREEAQRQFAVADRLDSGWRERTAEKSQELLAADGVFTARKAVILAKQLCEASDPSPRAVNLDLLGRAYIAAGKPDKGREIWQKALRAAESTGNTELAAEIRQRLTTNH